MSEAPEEAPVAEETAVDDNLPKNRPELLQLMLKEETDATDRTEHFYRNVLVPIHDFISNSPEILKACPDICELFTQYPSLIEARREYIALLDDNCTTENIAGPLGPWTSHIPKLLHFFALAFHHYYLHEDAFIQACQMSPALDELIHSKEQEFGYNILDFLKEDTDYPKNLLPTFELLDKYTDHAVPVPGKWFRLTVDEVKTSALMAIVKSTWQRCKAAKIDGIPDSVESKGVTMKFTLMQRPTTYGKYVDIEETKPDKSVVNLKGKVISKISAHSQANIKKIKNEIEANQRLHHPSILRMQMYLEDEVFHYLIFPDTEKMDLRDVLTANGSLCEEAARPIFRELITGVQHMHSNGVIHGQISPGCIQFYKNHVKLSDFSLCSLASRGQRKSTASGPLVYMSPESFKQKPFDGSVNDIWSCGVILYEMLAGQLPWTDKSKKALVNNIKRGNVIYPKSFSSSVIFLLKGILNPVPHDRFSIEQILSHAWMLKTREVPIASTLKPQEVGMRRRSKAAVEPV